MTKYSPVRSEPPKPTFNYLRTSDTVEKMLEQFLEEMTKVPGTDHTFYMTAIPIVDDNNCAVGIVSFKDICQGILAKPKDLPISPSKLLRDIMKQPLTADPTQTVSTIKMALVTVGQRDAFVVDDRLEFLGMIPDIHMIKNEVSNPNFPAKHKKILVPPDHLKLQLPDKSVLDMLREYNVESKLYYNFAVVDTLNLQTPIKLLGAVSYIEIFKALIEH